MIVLVGKYVSRDYEGRSCELDFAKVLPLNMVAVRDGNLFLEGSQVVDLVWPELPPTIRRYPDILANSVKFLFSEGVERQAFIMMISAVGRGLHWNAPEAPLSIRDDLPFYTLVRK